ncbi:MAG TPA: hypothetical protein VMZ03_12410 [Chitinophagaceae bacterium]|nr:hypothetical protein [Chitinophagaceae bacterium]
MSTKLVVDKQEGLREFRDTGLSPQPTAIKLIAHFFSYLFHPVFVPVYVVAFLVYGHPYIFAGFSESSKIKVMIQAFVMFSFFPIVTVLLLKALKFISSFHLTSQKDRVIPLVACGVWYFWIWYVWRNLPDYPQVSVQLALAIWISVSLALMANIIMKVSLHAIAAGVMLAFIILLALSQTLNFGFYISIALLVTGVVCTSRFIVSDHSPQEVYGGLFVGIISMLIANWFA